MTVTFSLRPLQTRIDFVIYEFPNQVTCSSTYNTSNGCKIQNKQEQEKSNLEEQLIYILPCLDSKVLG